MSWLEKRNAGISTRGVALELIIHRMLYLVDLRRKASGDFPRTLFSLRNVSGSTELNGFIFQHIGESLHRPTKLRLR